MPATRRSARVASSSQDSNPSPSTQSPKPAAGTKRKSGADDSPAAKRGKKDAAKQQMTIEETMDTDAPEDTESSDTKTQQEGHKQDGEQLSAKNTTTTSTEDQPKEDVTTQSNGHDAEPATNGNTGANGDASEAKPSDTKTESQSNGDGAKSSEMDSTGAIKPTESQANDEQPKATTDSAIQAHARDEDTPSSILEKGVIYFIMKGRVGIDNPSEVNDVARTYMILRPIPHGAKIGEGALSSGTAKNRLLALPKKVLPLNGKDKFMTFVEKAHVSFSDLKDDFLSASDYSTQTAGVRHAPSATPIAEGVYAITTTGRESHLAYMLTIPSELGDVQKDMGLREQGSFVTSVKNPQYAGPANTNLPQGPDFPKEILDEFRSLRWAPLQPKMLDYENAQFLLIGEDSGIEHALEPQQEDQKNDKNAPKEELEKLEGEDEIRVKHLKGEDAVFADLGVNKKEYSLQTTWGS